MPHDGTRSRPRPWNRSDGCEGRASFVAKVHWYSFSQPPRGWKADTRSSPYCILTPIPAGFGSTLRMSLDRRVLDVVSPERTFTGMGAHSFQSVRCSRCAKCWAPAWRPRRTRRINWSEWQAISRVCQKPNCRSACNTRTRIASDFIGNARQKSSRVSVPFRSRTFAAQ